MKRAYDNLAEGAYEAVITNLRNAGIDFDGYQDGRLAFSTEKKLKDAMRAAWIAGYRTDDAWDYLDGHNLTDDLDR